MSATIEERVVAMKFDNSNFEKNVKTSMSTLDKLKEALNFNSAKDSVKTLNEATKSVDFTKMANSIDSISDRFSALGIVGMSVLNNLTTKATDAAIDILGKVPSMIIQGGWKRATDVEQARFTLQGVVGDVEEVKRIMDDASDSVNGTAYAYNEAAKAASVFAASGLRSGKEMQGVLKAVAGTAATANADYEGIAHLFQTIAGQERVMGEQLNQFANRGINAAATLATFFNQVRRGTVEASDDVKSAILDMSDGLKLSEDVIEADIRDLVTQGAISFDIFSEAMSTTFGDHAKDANKTFSGSMANIRAALARTGEAFFKYIVEEEGPAVQLFNAIRMKINDMNKAWAPAAEAAAMAVNKIISSLADLVNNIPMINITHTLLNLFKILGNILRPFAQVIWSIGEAFSFAFDFGTISKSFYDITYQIEQFTKGLAFSEDAIKEVSKLFKGFFLIIDAVADIVFDFVSQIKIAEVPFRSFTDIIARFIGGIGDVLINISLTIRRSTGLKNAFSKLADTLNKFGETIASAFGIIASLFTDIFEASGSATKSIGEFVGAFITKGIEIFATILEKIVYLLDLFAKYIVIPALHTFVGLITSAANALSDFFSRLKESKRIQSAFEKISSAMERLFTAVKNVFKPLGDMFSSFHDNADKATDSVGSFLGSLAVDAITIFVEALAKVVEFLEKVAEKFVIPAVEVFIENIGKATGKLIEFAQTHSFTDFLDSVKDKLSGVINGFKDFFNSLDENDGILYRAVEGIKKMYENFRLLQGGASAHTLYDEETGEFIETVDEVSDKESIITKIADAFRRFGEAVKNAMKMAYDAIKNFFSYIKEVSPSQLADDIRERLVALKDKLKELIDNFKSWGEVTGQTTEGIKNPFEGATTAIKNFFAELDTDKLIALIFTGIMIGMLISIMKLTGAFTGLLKGITGMVDGFKKVSKSVSGFFDRLKNPKKSKILEFAEAIALVAAALAVLTLVDQNKLWNSLKVLSLTAVVLVALTAVIALIAKFIVGNKGIHLAVESLALTIISISASVLILTAAVKILESINFLAAEKAILLVAELGLVMIGLTAIMTRFVKGGIKGLFAMLGFAVVITRVAKALKEIEDINFENIQNNLEAFALVFGGLALVAFAASRMRLTAGLGLLIFVYALEKIFPRLQQLAKEVNPQPIADFMRDNLDVIYAIGGLVAAMIVVSGIFGKEIAKFGLGVALLAAAVAILAHTIKTISSIPAKDLELGLKVVGGILAIFAVLGLILSLTGGENSALKIAGAIAAMSLCLYPIAGAIWVIGTMDPKKVEQGLKAVEGIMFMFALIVAAASIGNGKTSVGAMVSITIAVIALMAELVVLTFIPYQQILFAAGSMAGVMLAFAAVLYNISKIPKVSVSTIVVIIEIAALSALIAYELYKLSDRPWESMLAAAAGLSVVLLALAKAVDIMDICDWKAGAGHALDVFLLSLSLFPIAGAIWLLRDVDWDIVLAAAAGFSIIVLALAEAVKIMDGVDWKTGAGHALDAIILSLALYPIAGAMLLVKDMDWEKMLSAAAAFGIMILALGASVRIMDGIDWKNAIGDAAAALILSIALFPIAAAINMLKDKPFKQYLGAATSMGILLLALGAAVRIMDGVDWKSAIPGAAACLILSVALLPIAYSINMLRGFNWQDMIGAAVALSIVLGVMTVITEVLSKFKVDFVTAVLGALTVVAVTTILIGLTALLAGLAGWLITDKQAAYIERGLDLVIMIAGKLGDAIGAFIGGIIGGAGMKILEDIGIGLEKFSEHASVFTDWARTIDQAVVDGVVNMAKALLIFGMSELLDAVNNFFGLGDISALVDKMTVMGDGLKAFADATADINYLKCVGALQLAQALFMLTPQNEGGFISWIVGDNKLSNFDRNRMGDNENGTGFGGGLKSFAEAVKGIKLQDVEGGIAVAEALFQLNPQNEGGFISWIVGDNTLGRFNKRRLGDNKGGTGFGGGLKAFAEAVKGIKYSDVNGGIHLAEALFALTPNNEGGFISLIVGDNSITKFNRKRLGNNEDGTGFGGGLKAFAEAVAGIQFVDVVGGLMLANAIFAMNPPNEGGFVAFVVGDNKVDKFNKKRLGDEGLGGGIAAFCESVSGLTYENLTGAYVAAEALKTLSEIDISENKVKKTQAYEEFTNRLVQIGDALASYFNSVKDIDSVDLANSISSLNDLLDAVHKSTTIDPSKVWNISYQIGRMGREGISKFVAYFKTETALKKIDNAMKSFVNKVTTSLQTHKKTAVTEMNTFADDMLSAYTSKTDEFNVAGSNWSLSGTEGFMSNQEYSNDMMEQFVNGNYDALIGENGLDFNGDISNLTWDIGDLSSNSFNLGWASNEGDATSTIESYINNGVLSAMSGPNGLDITGDVSGAMEKMTDIASGTFINGMGDISSIANIASVESATQAVTSAIESKAKEILNEDNFDGMANNVVTGLSNGFNKYSSIAESSATSLAAKIAQKFAAYNQINSPSKLYEGFGRYMDEGLAVGIDGYASEPIEAIGNVGSSMYDSLRDAMEETGNYISENMDVNPTITPYVDITGAMRDVQTLNSMFDDTALAYDMQSKFGDMEVGNIKDIDATNSDVVHSIETLRSDLSSLTRVVGNLKVYMDSGTLVGEIAPGMDNALGQMAMLKRRGV